MSSKGFISIWYGAKLVPPFCFVSPIFPLNFFLPMQKVNFTAVEICVLVDTYACMVCCTVSPTSVAHLCASSTWACFPAYSLSVLASSLVMTSWEMSTRLHSRSEIVCLACSTAPAGFLSVQTSIELLSRSEIVCLACSTMPSEFSR